LSAGKRSSIRTMRGSHGTPCSLPREGSSGRGCNFGRPEVPVAAGLRNPHNFLLNLTVPQRLVQRDEAQTQVARTLIHREETFGKCRSRADRPSIACSSTGKDSGKLRGVGDRATTFVRCRHNTRGTLIEPRNTGRPGESVRFSASDTPRGTRDNTPPHRSSALPGRTVGARHLHRTGG